MAITKKTINDHIKDMNSPDSTIRSVRVKTSMDGLYLVITKKGRCTWQLIYSFKGKQKSFSFGNYDHGNGIKLKLPALKERQAYDMAIALKSDIEAGIDVKEVFDTKKRHKKELDSLGVLAKVDAFTVNDVFDYFIEKVAKQRWREATIKNLVWSYNKHVKKRLGQELWDDVEFKQWRELFDGVAHGKWTGKSAPTAARELAKSLKQACEDAIYAEKVSNGAINSIKLTRIAPPNKEKDRTLNEYELGCVWDWCEPGDSMEKLVVKILLSTSARTHEVRVSEVQEWDLTTGVWTVPNAHSKNGDRIVRPIPDHLVDDIEMHIANARYACEGKTESQLNTHPLLGKVHSHSFMATQLSDVCRQLGLAKFTAHDLRRTCSTLQHELGMEHVVIESILGHRLPLVQRTYMHSTMMDGKREVLRKWHEYLEQARDSYLELAEGQ